MEYTGNASIAASGKPCRSWEIYSQTFGYTLSDFPDDTWDDASNKCRYKIILKGSVKQCVKSILHVSLKCIAKCPMIKDPCYIYELFFKINEIIVVT